MSTGLYLWQLAALEDIRRRLGEADVEERALIADESPMPVPRGWALRMMPLLSDDPRPDRVAVPFHLQKGRRPRWER